MRTDIRRYHLFIGPCYYPIGGMGEYQGTYPDLQAVFEIVKMIPEMKWRGSDTVINVGAETEEGLIWVDWDTYWIKKDNIKEWWWGWFFNDDQHFVPVCLLTVSNPNQHFIDDQFEAKLYAD
jgi:hypothetical protein